MRHNVRGPPLPRELEILARQHVPIQTKSKFHPSPYKITILPARQIYVFIPAGQMQTAQHAKSAKR
jgi:hypothetical protein